MSDNKPHTLCTPYDKETYEAIKAYSDKYKQSMAGVVRIAVLKFLESANMTPTAIPAPEAPTITVTTGDTAPIVTASYDNVATVSDKEEGESNNNGAPSICPVCNKEHNELGESALNIINSGTNWGVWACHECFSSGRWYTDKSPTILKNTSSHKE